jgi:hypothetical protein
MVSAIVDTAASVLHWHQAGSEPFPLLSLPANAVAHHLVPPLKPQDKAALALTCQVLRQVVHNTTPSLSLTRPGDLCSAAQRSRRLLRAFPNLEQLSITCYTPHDIMYAAPLLAMQLLAHLPKLHNICLTDAVGGEDDELFMADTAGGTTAGGLVNSVASMLTGTTGATTPHAAAAAGGGGYEGVEAGVCLSCEQEVSSHDVSGVILSLQAVAGDRITTLALITQVGPSAHQETMPK